MKCQVSRSHLANVLNGQMLPIPPLARRSASFAPTKRSVRMSVNGCRFNRSTQHKR